MTQPIRPFPPPADPAARTPAARPSAAARAAQRAFFQQAVGDASPVRTAPAMDVRARAPAAQVLRPVPAEKPDRILRPGSFVDVKV